jgi:hypothetical protein
MKIVIPEGKKCTVYMFAEYFVSSAISLKTMKRLHKF